MTALQEAPLGLWDDIKRFFAGTPASMAPAARGDLARVRDEMVRLAAAKVSFTVADIAGFVGASVDAVGPVVDHHFEQGLLAPFSYRRWERDHDVLFNPYTGTLPGEPRRAPVPSTRPVGPATSAAVGRAPAPVAAASAPIAPSYEASPEILGLSAEALRERALKIVPWRTAWIGRTDTIPPQSDERTAIIDRGLVLRGLLTEQQLAEIHTVGDAWLEVHESTKLTEARAHRSANEAIAALAEEKRQRKETRRTEAARRREERQAAIERRHAEDIIFLGRGVSSGLADRRSHPEKLSALGLPVLSTPKDIASALGLDVPTLRWLCFHSEAAERPHYITFDIPKRSGGLRRIAAPHQQLATAQRWVLEQVLDKLPVEPHAHGFVAGRSTVTNAQQHVGAQVVVNLDLKDFFPSITFPRVKGLFVSLGFSPAAATILALLCTEAPRRVVEYDGKPLHVATGPRALPQGACTSPAISNQLARGLDRRLHARLAHRGWTYTRYADDLSFSSKTQGREATAWLMAVVRHVADEEGFALNPKKGRVHVAASQQVVTGLVVNRAVAVPRAERRRLRAVLHQAQKTGLAAQNRANHHDFAAWVAGMVAYVHMANARHAVPLREALEKTLRGI